MNVCKATTRLLDTRQTQAVRIEAEIDEGYCMGLESPVLFRVPMTAGKGKTVALSRTHRVIIGAQHECNTDGVSPEFMILALLFVYELDERRQSIHNLSDESVVRRL